MSYDSHSAVGNTENSDDDELTPAELAQVYKLLKAHPPAKPVPLKPILDAIPPELRDGPYSVLWTFAFRNGRWTKVPINPHTGLFASADDKDSWGTFDQCAGFLPAGRLGGHELAGIGYMLGITPRGIVGVDLDKCRDKVTGEIAPWAVAIINRLDSYTEVSPSQTGVRIFLWGAKPAVRCRTSKGEKIEIYDTRRFLTMTGRRVEGTPSTLQPRQAEIDALHHELFPPAPERPAADPATSPATATSATTAEIVAVASRATNGAKFAKLWAGDWQGEYGSESDADLALASRLAFYVGPDVAKLDAVFRESPHYQNKDDGHKSKWDRDDYREARTLAKAIDREEFYRWPMSDAEAEAIYQANGGDAALAIRVEPAPEPASTPANATSPTTSTPTLTPTKGEPAMVDMSDVGNAILFCDLYGRDLRWVREWKKWLRWNGVNWQPVAAETIIAHYAQPMVRSHLLDKAKSITDDDRRKRWLSHVAASNAANRVRAMLDMAGPRLMVEVADLNKDPNLLATKNAVIDLRTCKAVEPDREQLITVATPVRYDPAAECPQFRQFVNDILVNEDGTPSPEMADYMQRAFGYCLTPSTEEQIFFVCHGIGKNGKSTLLETVLKVLGEYAIQGSDTLYFESRDRSNNEDEARLYGKRLCVTAETKDTAYFSSAKVKRITGGDRITASWKYQSQFEFFPTHKLFLLCNHRPKFDPSDAAMVRRIKLVPFNFVVAEDRKDTGLAHKLSGEAAGILNWMLDGLAKWNGGQRLDDDHTPEIMRAVKAAYVVENDDLNDFVEQHLTADQTAMAGKDDVYRRYRSWCQDVGKQSLNKNNLSSRLTARGWIEHRGGHGIRQWGGWKLKPTEGEDNLATQGH